MKITNKIHTRSLTASQHKSIVINLKCHIFQKGQIRNLKIINRKESATLR
jgi:hypothetical protein